MGNSDKQAFTCGDLEINDIKLTVHAIQRANKTANITQVESQMRDEQHWYRQLDGNPQHKTYVSTTPLPGVLDTIHQVSQVSNTNKRVWFKNNQRKYFTRKAS